MNKITTLTLPDFLGECSIGFDRMLNILDETVAYNSNVTYPPYNIIQVDEDTFVVELALAGFGLDNLKITQNRNKLTINGIRHEKLMASGGDIKYLHKGISSREFSREFVLAEHVTVSGAEFENGIVSITLKCELPDEMKPRAIVIKQIGK
jgi:molecular chaperone IbpA